MPTNKVQKLIGGEPDLGDGTSLGERQIVMHWHHVIFMHRSVLSITASCKVTKHLQFAKLVSNDCVNNK